MQEFKQRLLTQAEGLLVKRELRQISTTLPGAESAADRNAAIDECMRRWGQMPPAPDAAGDHDQPGAARNLNERARGHVRPGEPREDHNAG